MKRVFSPLHFNARSIGSICALLALPVLLGQAAFAGTVTFTDTPNDVASVVSATGFGTAAQGVITNNSCIDSHLIVTGSAWRCTFSVTAPGGATSFLGGGPFMANFYEGLISSATLEATLINTCDGSG